jgi:hypothetical protein
MSARTLNALIDSVALPKPFPPQAMSRRQLTIEDHMEMVHNAWLVNPMAKSADMAEMEWNRIFIVKRRGVNAPSVDSIRTPVKGAPPFKAPCWNTLSQDLPSRYVLVPIPCSDFFLRQDVDDGGKVFGLEKFQELAQMPSVNHEREAFTSLFRHSLSGPLQYYDQEVFDSTHPVIGNTKQNSRESQGATLPERDFFKVIKTKKYRIPTMPNALYLTIVCDWTNKAAAEKYGLAEETVKKNRAALVKESGYKSLDRLNPTIGAEYPANNVDGTHEGHQAMHLHAHDPVMGKGKDPNRWLDGKTVDDA